MLCGEYRHALDAKGRVTFPAKLREDLGDNFVITRGLDNCLSIYPRAEWDKLQEKIASLPSAKSRGLQRFVFGGACMPEPDKQGRVLIPATLRDYAALEKDVTIVGLSRHAEIWDSARWEANNALLTSDMIAGQMDELDF